MTKHLTELTSKYYFMNEFRRICESATPVIISIGNNVWRSVWIIKSYTQTHMPRILWIEKMNTMKQSLECKHVFLSSSLLLSVFGIVFLHIFILFYFVIVSLVFVVVVVVIVGLYVYLACANDFAVTWICWVCAVYVCVGLCLCIFAFFFHQKLEPFI